MIERRHSPSVEQSGLMSHLLHRATIARSREMYRWYFIAVNFRRNKCGSRGAGAGAACCAFS
jgi:hypothetical protein